MRKICLILFFTLSTICSFAENENVCVITNTGTGQVCTASKLGFVDPCSTLGFVVNYEIPVSAGYVIVAKYEWFVNGVSVKTTSNPSDPVLFWQIEAATTNVFCKVTYKKQDGTLSQEFPSNTFMPNVKTLNFAEIIPTTPSANYGCTTNPVSYSLNTYTCTGQFCSSVYNATQYQISWQPPSGWTQTSISANGNSVSFLPDATTGGTLTATITLPCGFTETRTSAISRETEKPTFLLPPSIICSSSANFTINSICGAVNYTYTIIGHAGITFATNGQQTLTTNSTTVNLNVSGTGSTFYIKAKTNFPSGFVSQEAITQSSFGAPDINNFNFLVNGPSCINYNNQALSFGVGFNGYFGCQLRDLAGITEVEWNVICSNPYQVTYNAGAYTCQFPLQVNKAGLSVAFSYPIQPYVITFLYRVKNACGWSDWSPGNTQFIQSCGGGWRFVASPNPTQSSINVSLDEETIKNDKFSSIREIQLVDKFGKVVKQFKFGAGNKRVTINLSELKADIYFIRLFNGKEWKGQSVIKQ